MFLKNAWYVAAWSSELNDQLLSRRILDEPLVIFRKGDGTPAALFDRCPHRFAPLHRGKLQNDTLQCGYHGLCFNTKGECILNPNGEGTIPKAAKVRSYRVVERNQFIWIWMGDTDKADDDAIPDYTILSSNEWSHATGGYLHSACNYELMIDNLMDLCHVNFLHPLFGDDTMTHGKQNISEGGGIVECNTWIPKIKVPGYLQSGLGVDTLIDQWLDMKWTAPSNLILNFGGTPTGQPRQSGTGGWAAHVLTPETEMSTHYFFSMSCQGSNAESAALAGHAIQKDVFANEDKPMVQACQEMMGDSDFWSLKPVLLANDAGAVRVRRVLKQLIESQSS
jgi:phenylpropionate dioxygenase-like ring-hydroxylating dioxygenase large terminal subunit